MDLRRLMEHNLVWQLELEAEEAKEEEEVVDVFEVED